MEQHIQHGIAIYSDIGGIMNIFFGFEVDENISEDDKWNIIFVKRSNLLSRCDWTQLPDSGLSFLKRLEWQTYRDALRSIQDDFPTPDDVIFPPEPAEE